MTKIKLFGAEWCQACKLAKPLLERLGEVEYIDIDSDSGMEEAQALGIRGVPTYVNTENGKRGSGALRSVAAAKEILGVE